VDGVPRPATTPTLASASASGDTVVAALSPDGRFAVLASAAPDLTANPHAGTSVQLYLQDTLAGGRQLVSGTPAGTPGQGHSGDPTVSADGRWVVFASDAADLVAGDTNAVRDIFLRDTLAGITFLISRAPDGTPASGGFSDHPVMTPDGVWIAFTSQATNLASGVLDNNRASDVFLLATATRQVQVVSRQFTAPATGTSASFDPVLSPDGRWLAFTGTDGKLAQSTPAGTAFKLFLRSTAAETNSWASQAAAGFDALVPLTQKPEPRHAVFSANGAFLAYTYGPLVLRLDLETGQTSLVASNFVPAVVTQLGSPRLVLSVDGQICAWEGGPRSGDTLPTIPDSIYLRDAASQTTTRLQPPLPPAAGLLEVGAPALSTDGQQLVYAAQVTAPDTAELGSGRHWFLHHRGTGETRRLYLAGSAPGQPMPALQTPLWAADLSTLAFSSAAADVAPDDLNRALDAFRFETATGEAKLLSAPDPAVPGFTAGGGSAVRGQCFSADGRFLVFTSSAADLAPADHNGVEDIFVRDLHAGTTHLVSVSQAGTRSGNGASHSPILSADGRWVAFVSLASDLVNDDANGLSDVFLHDLETGATRLVSRNHEGTASANGSSHAPALSADGRRLAFASRATDLLPPELPDHNGARSDVFVFDRETGATQLVSIGADGTGTGNDDSVEPILSPDGRYVLFRTRASSLVSPPPLPRTVYPDTLACVRDLETQTTTLVTDPSGVPVVVSAAEPQPLAVSANGSTFAVAARQLLQPFSGTVVYRFPAEWVAEASLATYPQLSGDGSLLVFSARPPTGPAPRQVLVQHLADGTTNLVSVSRDGETPGNGSSYQAVVSADGRYVVFKSLATDLVPFDDNGYGDLFVRDMVANRTMLLSARPTGATPNHGSLSPVLAPDGRTVAFLSWATDLTPGDRNRAADVFVLRLGSGPAADADEDGLPDDWEVAYFNSLVRDGAGDWDGDGRSDRDEYLAGTDPTNAGSVLRVLTLTGTGGDGVTVIWSATPGRTYEVQFKDTVDAPWAALEGDVEATGATAAKLDSSAAASLQRFYRAVLK
jgi:Tol biopolymer transport system component